MKIAVENFYVRGFYRFYDVGRRRLLSSCKLAFPKTLKLFPTRETVPKGSYVKINGDLLVLYREKADSPLRLLLEDRVYDFEQLSFSVKQIDDTSRNFYETRYIREVVVHCCDQEIYRRRYSNVVHESYFDEFPEDFDFYLYMKLLSTDERAKKSAYTTSDNLRTLKNDEGNSAP